MILRARMKTHSRKDPRGAVAAAAVLCAVVSVLCVRSAPLLYHNDAVHYVSLAEHLARGQGYRSAVHFFHDLMQPPLFPMLIAAVAPLMGSAAQAAVLVCVLAQVAALLALVRLHRAVWGPSGVLATATVAAVYPNLAFGGALTLEPVFLCLLAWATVAAVAAGRRGSAPHAGVCGLLAGLALLVRPEVVVTVPVLAALLWLWPRANETGTGRRRRAVWLLAFGAAVAVVVIPYGLWIESKLGYFEVLPKVRYNIPVADINDHMAWDTDERELIARDQRTHYSLMPDRATFVLNRGFVDPTFDPRTMYPRRPDEPAAKGTARAVVQTAVEIAREGVAYTGLFNPVLAALLVLGAWRGLRRGRDESAHDPAAGVGAPPPGERERRVLAGALVALVACHLGPALVSGDDLEMRYVAASMLFAVPLIGGGAGRVVHIAAARWPRLSRGGWEWIVAASLVVAYGVLTARTLGNLSGGRAIRERTEAVERACNRLVPEGAGIMADKLRFGILRGGRSLHLPYVRSLDELVAYATHHRVDYAILDARTLRKNPSRINRALVDPSAWPPGWTPIAHLFQDDTPIWIAKVR